MTFVVTLAALLLVVTAMSVGVIMGRKPISGSCGGVGAALGEDDYVCELCGGDESKCEELSQQENTSKNSFLAYEAKSEKK
jgi:hypothetical protein